MCVPNVRDECERGGAIDSESTTLCTNTKRLFDLEELGIHFSKNLLQCGLLKCLLLKSWCPAPAHVVAGTMGVGSAPAA